MDTYKDNNISFVRMEHAMKLLAQFGTTAIGMRLQQVVAFSLRLSKLPFSSIQETLLLTLISWSADNPLGAES